MRIIGSSKVGPQNKVTIIEQATKILEIQPGDQLAFLVSSTGDIIIKNQANLEIIDR